MRQNVLAIIVIHRFIESSDYFNLDIKMEAIALLHILKAVVIFSWPQSLKVVSDCLSALKVILNQTCWGKIKLLRHSNFQSTLN